MIHEERERLLARYREGADADILERVSEEDQARRGTHTESGPYGAEDWLRIYADHRHDHAAQIRPHP